jgi:hypothetical protein
MGKKLGIMGMALILLGGAGCNGVLLESKKDDGRVERVVIDGGEGWNGYEERSRYPQTRTKDEYYIMLKKEATF